MNGVEQVSWPSLVASSLGGALFGVVAATLWWLRRSRRSRTVGGHGAKIKVYHTPTFRSARVAWMLAELGAEEDYEMVSYNPYVASDDERQWYVDSVHPHGTVPAMVDDGRGGAGVMLESAAICMYLAERHGRLLPQPDAMSDYLDWCVYAVATVDRCLSTIDIQLALDTAQQDANKLQEAFAAADSFARRLEKQLNKRSFICGSTLTAVDVVVGYCVMWTSVIKGGRIIYDYPNVKSYLTRLKSRPKFATTMGTPREWVNRNREYAPVEP